jgi:hypothetical protein
MSELRDLNENLEFVRSAVARARVQVGSPAIYFLWAAICGIGFSLPAIAPGIAWQYWVVAGLGGGGLSIWLGQRHAKASGIVDRELARRHGMHWLACGLAMAVILAGFLAGRLQWEVALPLLVSVSGLAYLLAGIHFYPPLCWAGGLLLVSGMVMWWVPGVHMAVFTGIAMALSLCVAGVTARRALHAT